MLAIQKKGSGKKDSLKSKGGSGCHGQDKVSKEKGPRTMEEQG